MDWNKSVLGLELGSTRIKAVLLDEAHQPVASGSFDWENELRDGIWTYSMEAIHHGVQACYASLNRAVEVQFGHPLTTVGAMGISGMMHGYLPFDRDWNLLTPFRTWRNTITGQAAEVLTEAFGFQIPQRWSIAHLYQAMCNGEAHLSQLAHLTTLAGYIHWRLSGEHMLGIGEASGMFPIDSQQLDYHQGMVERFAQLAEQAGVPCDLRSLLPRVLPAGEPAGVLTAAGAAFLDPAGNLRPGIPLAPPEGDAGTGMTATNSVRVGTGNVSAGTSDFAMVVVDCPLKLHREIDMVTTPAGLPVAMVHCNNCTSDLNAWVGLLDEFARLFGLEIPQEELYTRLFCQALAGEADGGGLLSFNYLSGEGVTALDAGRPVFARLPDARLTLPNFMRTHLLSALATLKLGLDILTEEEQVTLRRLCGHGGFFRTPQVGQRMLSAAVGVPVTVMDTAGEGGPYGMALLAAYLLRRAPGEGLEDYLDSKVFAQVSGSTLMADARDVEGFRTYLARYRKALPLERAAIETMEDEPCWKH